MTRYADAGVEIDAANRAKKQIKRLARATFNARVHKDIGAFGGFFSLAGLPSDTVLVASTDGVGTKLKIAFEMNRHAGVAADLVHHCVNDIAVHGATPLFFLDYLATGRLRPKVVAEIVRGIAGACRHVGCALIGGETAEMPGFYPEDEYDLAGTIVGWVRRREIISGERIRPGDLVLGLASAGLHTNGFSLARKVLLEQAGGRAPPGIAVVIPGKDGESVRVSGERRQRATGGGEFLGVTELRQVAGAHGVVGGSRGPRERPQRLLGAVVLAAPAFPQLDRGERPQRAQLAQRAPAPVAELHVHVREVDQLHSGRSATANRPRPPSASSSFKTRRPAVWSKSPSSAAEKRP